MNFRIGLEDHLLPVQMFFNAIPEREFIDVMSGLSEHQGYGFGFCVIEFPEDAEEEDTPFIGVRFCLPTEEATVSNADFIRYAEMACQVFLCDHPGDKEQVANIIDRMRENFSS